jgi:hypothetical protein
MDELEAQAQMDELWDRGNAFLKEFGSKLDSKSQTARSIERGDYWSETASWARRDGYDEFAREVDRRILEYNALVTSP